MPRRWIFAALCQLAVLLLAGCARADVTVLMEEPYGEFGHYNPTGHAAVYLNNLCAETPVLLRPCKSGERGAVISRYHRVAGFDWVAIPPIPYFYAVHHRDEIPMSADRELRDHLRNEYRIANLEGMIPDATGTSLDRGPRGNWTELVGESYDRRIYGFRIQTEPESDLALMSLLNDRSNQERFNLFTRNCADFTKGIVNFYYPHALRRNILVDWGITTPKQDARRLISFAKKHKELKFASFTIPQVPGSIPRSRRIDNVAEALSRSKKYVIPLAVISPEFAGAMIIDVVAEDHSSLSPKTTQQLP
jgi:hypothetical protein